MMGFFGGGLVGGGAPPAAAPAAPAADAAPSSRRHHHHHHHHGDQEEPCNHDHGGRASDPASGVAPASESGASDHSSAGGVPCWICLEAGGGGGGGEGEPAMLLPCKCPRPVHPKCLARWQLQSAGKTGEFVVDRRGGGGVAGSRAAGGGNGGLLAPGWPFLSASSVSVFPALSCAAARAQSPAAAARAVLWRLSASPIVPRRDPAL